MWKHLYSLYKWIRSLCSKPKRSVVPTIEKEETINLITPDVEPIIIIPPPTVESRPIIADSKPSSYPQQELHELQRIL